jgi:hypothetical protein
VVPSSVLGLAFFVVLLAPGLVFVLRHEQVVPARSLSGFRESLRVIFVSVACLTVTAVLLALLRGLFPGSTPDIGDLVRDPSGSIRRHHAELAWWALVGVLFATLLGAVVADSRVVGLLRAASKVRPVRWLTGTTDTGIRHISAWYRVMHLYDDENPGPVLIGSQMDDGTYVEGRLFSFNVAAEDDQDRDILLSAPLYVTTVDGVRHDFGAQFAVISAHRVVRLDVTHLDLG